MATVITPYNHTAARIRSGSNGVGDTYKVNLYSVLPFLPAATTKAAAEVGATQLPTANGYTQDSMTLTGSAVVTVSTNGANWTVDDVTWNASGGDLVASFAMLYNDSDSDDPPMYHLDFGGPITALDGSPFVIIWDAGAVDSISVTPP
jgi:hypothetical protein